MNCPKCGAAIPEDSSFCGKCGTRASSSNETVTRTDIHGRAGDVARGEVLAGKYRIVEELGRGGMGIVYRAEDMKLNRAVALKFLPPAFSGIDEARGRFLLEARAAAALSHPNICTIHEVNDQDERPFIVMEYVEGSSLRARMRDHALEANEAVEIALQVADALEEAHGKGIIHRDIKSANVMLTPKGQAKVMDFGLAKVRGESLNTREGTTLGTVAYMSPEQAQGKPVDHRTDVWALGVVLYEMLSGRLPFGGEHHSAVLYAVVHEEPQPLKEAPAQLTSIVERALKKDLKARYGSAAEMAVDLRRYREGLRAAEVSVLRFLRQPKVAIPAAVGLALLCVSGWWLYERQSKIRWARETAIPEIERLLLGNPFNSDWARAYRLAEEAEKYLGRDSKLSILFEKCSVQTNVRADPAGTGVYIKDLSAPDTQWRYLGMSPLAKIRLPVGPFLWKFEKQGYETVIAMEPTFGFAPKNRTFIADGEIQRTLDSTGKIPEGMVRVMGGTTASGRLGDFFLDRYEVTNDQYKEFVDAGGYRDRKYWKQEFIKDGKRLTWEAAMAEFVDQSGRSGPSTWSAGDHPKGQDQHPVSGVSWYEAAAYAESRGKSLPTLYHWELAAGLAMVPPRAWLAQASNFGGEGPAAVGSHHGVTAFGAYDMAGNVREWCWNAAKNGRVVRGGAWNDATYMSENISQASSFDRSPKNGFRCTLYRDPDKIPEKAFAAYMQPEPPDFYRQRPASDSVFNFYKEQFAYDKQPPGASTEWRNDKSADWIQEKVSMDAAYGNEKLPVYVFLPRNSPPPYQAVIYFPGSHATYVSSSQNLDEYWEFVSFLSFIVKNGRAVVFPVYKGTFERRDDALTEIHEGVDTRRYREFAVQLVQDFRTTIDYLEARPEIDARKLAYLGFSWGGVLGAIIPAVENRLKASVLVLGGFNPAAVRPEVQQIQYVTRVKVPTLMLNGRFDTTFPYDTSAKPMFDLLGSPSANKRLVVYDTDHFVPRNEMIKETLAWLDKYLGPVK